MKLEAGAIERQAQGMGDAQMQALMQGLQQLQATVDALATEMARRAAGKIVRDQRGRVAGTVDAQGNPISMIERDANGRVAGVKPASNLQ